MQVRLLVAEPGLLMYVPSPHVAKAVHWLAFKVAAVWLPLGVLKVFAGQAVQTRSFCAEPAVLTYVPAAQLLNARQVRLAGVLNWPEGQFAQTVFVVGVPAAV